MAQNTKAQWYLIHTVGKCCRDYKPPVPRPESSNFGFSCLIMYLQSVVTLTFNLSNALLYLQYVPYPQLKFT